MQQVEQLDWHNAGLKQQLWREFQQDGRHWMVEESPLRASEHVVFVSLQTG